MPLWMFVSRITIGYPVPSSPTNRWGDNDKNDNDSGNNNDNDNDNDNDKDILVLWPYSSCRGLAFRATAIFFVLRHCASCCGNALRAVARKWCAAALHGISRRGFFVHRQETTCCRAAALFTARNDVPQHAALSFFILQQETTRCCGPWHCASWCVVPWFRLLCHGHKDEKNNQPVQRWPPQWRSGVRFGLVGCCVFCGGCCFVGFLREKTINLFGFGGLGGVVVMVFGGIFDFVVFCSGIVHSSAAFCGVIFVPQHCFMCRGIALCAAAFFVPRGCFCAMVFCFVLRQCDWCLCIVLCHGIAQCAMALLDVLVFVPWHCATCRDGFFLVSQRCAMCRGIVVFLCFVQWHCFLCHATALCNVPQHCTMCCSIVQHAAALCSMLQHFVVCCSVFLCGGTANCPHSYDK